MPTARRRASGLSACSLALLAGAGSRSAARAAPTRGLRPRAASAWSSTATASAYFEREGRVDADQVTFRVRNEKVGDFLATLAVIEKGGSSVRSASFPVEVDKDDDEDEDEDDGRTRASSAAQAAAREEASEKKDKLETVKLTLDGKEHDLIVGYVAETPVWRPSYRLVINRSDGRAGEGASSGGSPGLGHRAEPLGRGLEGRQALARRGRAARVPGDAREGGDPAAPDRHRSGRGDRLGADGRDQPGNSEAAPPPPPADAPMPRSAPAKRQGYTLDELMARRRQRRRRRRRRRGDSGPRAAEAARRAASGGAAAKKASRLARLGAQRRREHGAAAASAAHGAAAAAASAAQPVAAAQRARPRRGRDGGGDDALRPAVPRRHAQQERDDGAAPRAARAGRVDLPLRARRRRARVDVAPVPRRALHQRRQGPARARADRGVRERRVPRAGHGRSAPARRHGDGALRARAQPRRREQQHLERGGRAHRGDRGRRARDRARLGDAHQVHGEERRRRSTRRRWSSTRGSTGTRLHNAAQGDRGQHRHGQRARAARRPQARDAPCSTWTSARRRAGRSTGSIRSPTTR